MQLGVHWQRPHPAGLDLDVSPSAASRQPHRHQRTRGVSRPDSPLPLPQVDELDVLSDGLDELLTVADAHAELAQDDAQVGRALG